MNWFTITHSENTALIGIGNDLGTNGSRFSSFADFQRKLGNPGRVDIQINSTGGDANCGVQLYDHLKCFDTVATITGICYSSAVTVALAARKRTMWSNARILIHKPSAYIYGAVEVLQHEADSLKKLTDRIREIIATRTGQPLEVVSEWLSKDTYFDAETALGVGLVDEVIEPPALPMLTRQAVAGANSPKQPTEQELIFKTWLDAFGPMEVSDKEKFGRDLAEWLRQKVRQV